MQLRKSPGGRNAQLAAQPPGAAAVVGHGDDGRDVAGVLLEPPQQGRKARAAADGHDLRAALQLALLKDDVRQAVDVLLEEDGRDGTDSLADAGDDQDEAHPCPHHAQESGSDLGQRA